MPTQSLARDYFAFIREEKIIQNSKEKQTVLGYFSTIKSTTRFFGLQEIAAATASVITITRKAGTRVNTRIDGDAETVSPADQTQGGTPTKESTKSSQVLLGLSKGSKTIRLQSGKPIPGSSNANAKYTCSFRFPGYATNLIISNVLGDLLPPDNVAANGATPTAEQIFPYFISSGGKRYPIAAQSAAQSDTTEVVVPKTADQLAAALGTGQSSEKAE